LRGALGISPANSSLNPEGKKGIVVTKRVLIVDDDVAAMNLLKGGLEKTGAFEVRAESSASRALPAAREFRPDLILLDIVLPDGDGGEIAARILADHSLKRVPIIFLTSLLSEWEEAAGGPLRGPIPILAKPASLEKVLRCIEPILGIVCQPNPVGAA
jgi:two-component system OmpR family response regulator